jgi:hypothetical protein
MERVRENARRAADLVFYLAVVLVAWILPEPGDLRAAVGLLNARICMSVRAACDPRMRDDFPVVARLIYQTLLAGCPLDNEGMPHADHQSG